MNNFLFIIIYLYIQNILRVQEIGATYILRPEIYIDFVTSDIWLGYKRGVMKRFSFVQLWNNWHM